MGSRQRLLAVSALLLGVGVLSAAEPADGPSEPELLSAFPLGARVGSTLEVEVKGKGLEEVYAAWFECHDVHASIKRVEELKGDSVPESGDDQVYAAAAKDPATHRVMLKVTVDPHAELGLHGFRLVTPRGMSNGLALHVVPERVVVAGDAAHQCPAEARSLKPPVVVNGKMENKGELDFYAIQAARGDAFLFQAFSNFKPAVPYRAKVELALYDAAGSWFDPDRLHRINLHGPALSWEPMYPLTRWFDRRTFPTQFVLFPRLTHQFQKQGRYLVSVGAFLGAGAPGHSYMLRIAAPDASGRDAQPWFGRLAHTDPGDWLERDSSTLRQWGSFSRRLEPTRLQALRCRSVTPAGGNDPHGHGHEIIGQCEAEPNDQPQPSRQVSLPAIIEGILDEPADTDYFTFQAAQGEKLAFEIETPRFGPPIFNPWIRVRDGEGRVLFANIYKEYGGDGDDVNKNLERKTLYTFQQAGTYSLEVRDLSVRAGGADFRYRMMIRPQIPHLGRVEVNLDVVSESSVLVDRTDHINLAAGRSKEIVLVCDKEEGFDGSLAVGAQNLPEGVELLSSSPSARTESLLTGFQYRPPDRQVMAPDNYRPRRCPVTVLLYARPDAPRSTVPEMVRLTVRPIVGGRTGAALPIETFPLMVVAPPAKGSPQEEADQQLNTNR